MTINKEELIIGSLFDLGSKARLERLELEDILA